MKLPPPLAAARSKQAVVLLELVPCNVCVDFVFIWTDRYCAFRLFTSCSLQPLSKLMTYYLGLNARKSVFDGLRKTKMQTSLRISAFVLFIGKYHIKNCYKQNFAILASLWVGWFLYVLIGNPEDRFSHVATHFNLESGSVKVSMPGNAVTADCDISWYWLVWVCCCYFFTIYSSDHMTKMAAMPLWFVSDLIWASSRENLSSGVSEQHRRRPACASAQSDQRLCYSPLRKYHM